MTTLQEQDQEWLAIAGNILSNKFRSVIREK